MDSHNPRSPPGWIAHRCCTVVGVADRGSARGGHSDLPRRVELSELSHQALLGGAGVDVGRGYGRAVLSDSPMVEPQRSSTVGEYTETVLG